MQTKGSSGSKKRAKAGRAGEAGLARLLSHAGRLANGAEGLEDVLRALLRAVRCDRIVVLARRDAPCGCQYASWDVALGAGVSTASLACVACMLLHSGRRGRLGGGSRFVGRVAELAAFERALLDGVGARHLAVLPLGEPGEGHGYVLFLGRGRPGMRAERLEQAAGVLSMALACRGMAERLEGARRIGALGELAGGIVHDFNNILTSIDASLQLLLLDTREGTEACEDLKDIAVAVARAAGLARQLLLLARPGGGGQPAAVPVAAQLRQMLRLLQRTVGPNIRVSLEAGQGECLAVFDEGGFHHMILNLTLNARDAMPGGGALTLTVAPLALAEGAAPVPGMPPGSYVRIGVTDTGEGIRAEHLPRIFSPFFSTKGLGSGTGLGLSQVASMVREHGGYVAAQSPPGRGTTVTVYLRAAQRARAEAGPSQGPLPRGEQETVLLVEAEAVALRARARLLERYGYRTLTACDGLQALAAIRDHKDRIRLAVLTDEMAGMSGRECLAHLRVEAPHVPVVVVGSSPIERLGWNPRAAGAASFLEKPFDAGGLLRAIRGALAGAEARQPAI